MRLTCHWNRVSCEHEINTTLSCVCFRTYIINVVHEAWLIVKDGIITFIHTSEIFLGIGPRGGPFGIGQDLFGHGWASSRQEGRQGISKAWNTTWHGKKGGRYQTTVTAETGQGHQLENSKTTGTGTARDRHGQSMLVVCESLMPKSYLSTVFGLLYYKYIDSLLRRSKLERLLRRLLVAPKLCTTIRISHANTPTGSMDDCSIHARCLVITCFAFFHETKVSSVLPSSESRTMVPNLEWRLYLAIIYRWLDSSSSSAPHSVVVYTLIYLYRSEDSATW